MGFLKSVKKAFNQTNLYGWTSKAIEKATGISQEKQYAIGGTTAAATALLGALTGGATETGGVISTAPDGTQILYTDGGNMGILSSIGSAASSLLGNVGSSLISGGLSAYGNIYGADTSAANAKEINERQIQWERERATNAHQWEIQDLRNAGLNPVLSAGGQGAATGGISAVQPDTSGYGRAGESISNAIAIMQKQQEIDNQTKLTDAQSSKLGADTAYTIEQSKWLPPAQKASLKKTAAETVALKANTAKTAAQIENINKGTELRQAEIWHSYHKNRNLDAQAERLEKGELNVETPFGTYKRTANFKNYRRKWDKTQHQWKYYK